MVGLEGQVGPGDSVPLPDLLSRGVQLQEENPQGWEVTLPEDPADMTSVLGAEVGAGHGLPRGTFISCCSVFLLLLQHRGWVQ